MLGEALRFPIAGDSALKNHLLGGILAIFGFLLIPAFFVQGYLVRVLRVAVEGGEEPPEFDEWGDLLVDGLKLFVVNLAYFIVPTIVLFVSIFAFVGTAAISSGAPGEVDPGAVAGASIVGLLFMLLAMLLFFLAAYLVPAAAANFARHDDLGKAFEFGTVVDAAFSADYFVAVLFAILVGLVVGAVTFFLSIIVVGLILVPFLSFYTQVATYYLFGRGYAKALGVGGAGGPTTTPTATYE
jgi:hypothetical protein